MSNTKEMKATITRLMTIIDICVPALTRIADDCYVDIEGRHRKVAFDALALILPYIAGIKQPTEQNDEQEAKSD